MANELPTCTVFDSDKPETSYHCAKPAVVVYVTAGAEQLTRPICAEHRAHHDQYVGTLYKAQLVPNPTVARGQAIRQFGLSLRETEDVVMKCFPGAHNGEYADFDWDLERPITDPASLNEAAYVIVAAYVADKGGTSEYQESEQEYLTFELTEAMNKKFGANGRWGLSAETLDLMGRTGLTPLS